jgi:iron complex outermembrane receptor protein
MVPGVQVAQINANKWAISVRGFNGQYSNKLLVMVDGRTIYTPTFSGVFWDSQDIPLDTIERIEVIRGPGATVWGANAVNGVINIITKPAQETPGTLLTGGAGTHDAGFGNARHGGKLGTKAAYRIFTRGVAARHFPQPGGGDGSDDWHSLHGGFRADSEVSPQDSLMLEADAYSGNAGERASAPVSIWPPVNQVLSLRDRFSGWNVLSRWNHVVSGHSDTSLQFYFDRETRGDGTYGIGINTVDLDFQHHLRLASRHDLVWGLGYRVSSDTSISTLRVSFTPAGRQLELFSGFLQDEIALRPDRVFLSIGAKLEHSDYNQLAFQPSARVTWKASDRQMFWAAVSRAERTPARGDDGLRINYGVYSASSPLPMMISMFGNPQEKPEELIATEAGYRTALLQRLSLDWTVFYNHYQHLVSIEPGAPYLEVEPLPHVVVPSRFGNLLHGESHGVEVFGNYKVSRRWSLMPGYSFIGMHLHAAAQSGDTTMPGWIAHSMPQHQAQLQSRLDLPGRWQWNLGAYFVDRVPSIGVPSYTRLDSNLSWQASERFMVTIAGQNLLRDRHQEYGGIDSSVLPSMIERSAYARFSWAF